MIVKTLINNEFVINYNKEMGFFACEFGIYGEILPMMEKLKCKKKVAPQLYHLSTDLKNSFIIEDLAELNYKMANRQEGLNLTHCLFVIKKLAYFHASSLAIYEKNPKIMDQYNKGLFHRTNMSENVFSITCQELQNSCKAEPSLRKYYEKITEDMIEKVFDSAKRDLTFNVLNHGDFWCNNFMFHYDADGRLDDVLFIDFQGSVFASPFLDLHYFIVSSTNLEVKENHIYDVLHHYYETFVETAKILEIRTAIPNWNDFKKDFCDKAFIGLVSICVVLPIVKAEKMENASFANYMENGEEGSFRHHCFNNSAYINTIKWLLPFYDGLGAFKS
ncbi:hypothetical protein RN001_013737 [Aquatica leii]|uniref:CHK kinase-like domain-containing protein n=1 Tax=Aquatica leii TaxID=1421715 RepID=A0AAN7P0F8_9COLE|nr:hypothetical protein RN001_013737 [Aquatica leii]